MTTREKILFISLDLFAQSGYDGVSVREIARHVGVRESALYKHFDSKEDILSKIILEVKERVHEAYVSNGVPEAISDDFYKGYGQMSEKKLSDIAVNLFTLFTEDHVVANFRRLLMREQFGNPEIAKLYDQFYLDGVIESQSKTFKVLSESGYFKKADSKIIALQFYGPILLLFQQYDCEPEHKEAIKRDLLRHVLSFGQLYGQK